MKISSKVQSKLHELPDKPGVYLMRDRDGRVIYIGKAVSLRKRVRQYFRQGTLRSAEPKLRGLIRSIDDFDYLVVRNEAEATLTEGRFIKEYRPRYNTFFRDDKRFLILRIHPKDPYPRFTLCRFQRDDGAIYFGPYASAASARATKAFVEKRFGLRACRPRVPGATDYKHCLNDIIRYCSAPCIGKISPEAYRERVAQACAFLRGEAPEHLADVENEMRQQAEAMNYEKAAALRDTLALLRRAVRQRATGKSTLEMKVEDARRGVDALQAELGLPRRPEVIECYDISNISGTHAVGSMVCAVEGMPQRNRYRLFRIKTVQGSDDPGMMAEVIKRRFSRLLVEKKSLPDLVLVDGGPTQLHAARKELDALGLETLPALGLAKRFEEIYAEPNSRMPVRLALDSPALKVLQRIRDEAHRFALMYHRKLRGRKIRDSALDEIPGIGAKRKRLLLEHFGSVARLRKARVEQIAEVPGIGTSMARLIREELGVESDAA